MRMDTGEELSNGDEILKPGEDLTGAGGNGHVGDQGDGRRDGNAPVGNTLLAALEKDLRSLAVLGNAKEVAGAGVQERVGRGRSRS